ncbi:MAG: PAS-domain containing protein [Xanthobacteraceae bacterium]
MHKLFAKQLAKATDRTGLVELPKLCNLVAAAYDEFDRDRTRTDRSISLMVEELDQIQRNLERTVVERTKELRAREAELQAQNLRIDAALSNMSHGLAMYDAEACLVLWNHRFVAMCRYRHEDGLLRHAPISVDAATRRQWHVCRRPR